MSSIGGFLLESCERLTSSNYSIWKVRMESLLVIHDLYDIVLGEEEEPQGGQELARYKKKARLALHCLKMNVSNDLLNEVSSCISAKEAWDSLKAIYESNNTSRVLMIRNQILQSMRRSDENAQEYVLRIKSLNKELSSIGEKILENELVQVILNGLGDEFSNLVQTFAIQDTLPSIDKLHNVLVAEECRMLHANSRMSSLSLQDGDERVNFSFKGKKKT